MNLLEDARRRGSKVFIFGNGGSAATASHFCCDFNKGVSDFLGIKYNFECLNDNVPTMMAVANDISYDEVFSYPLKNKIDKNDIANPETIRHTHFGFNFRLSDICSAFALAQLEKLDELVAARIHCAEAFREAAKGVSWLKPQRNPENCVNSYWTAAFSLDTDVVPWHSFHKTFLEKGGDGFYGAWRLAYNEPWFAANVEHAPCPNAEYLQPRMLQMKTNYGTEEELATQIRAFKATIETLDKTANR